MKKALMLCFFLVAVLLQQAMAQSKTVTGTVTDAATGQALPGVAVIVKGTTVGTTTGANGAYSINVPAGKNTLVYRFIGYNTLERAIGNATTINVDLATDTEQLQEVVVTALGFERAERTVTYASQEVEAKDLNITQGVNVKDALAGKVAGVQINGQAGSKLGQFGKIRIRGAISLTSDSDPLYIVDGVPTPDPNEIDMNNVESINVLKGPNATSLYGQRADAGVVVITTKKGSGALAVEVANSTTWDKVGYLPNYQDLYGGGYDGNASFGTFDFAAGAAGKPYPAEWEVFDGKRYLLWDNNYADESWGPAFDGQEYVPWYAWWPGTEENPNPYFGKTAKYEAQPDNIKDFYDTGITQKTTVALSGGNEKFNGRLAYTLLDQTGITPYSDLLKHFVNANFGFQATEKLRVNSNIRYATSEINGDFDDGYGNQTTGSFNSWFARDTDINKLRELRNLTTPDGYSTSWNWWGPDYYTYYGGGFQKPAFWFNPYTFLDKYDQTRNNDNLAGSLTATYEFDDHWEWSATGSLNSTEYKSEYFFPFYLSNSAAPDLYNAWSNSFGRYSLSESEKNFSSVLKYENRFGEFDITAFVGGNIRKNDYYSFSAQMSPGAKTGGLIVPDVYTFSNAGIVPTPQTYIYEKQVNSLYGNASLGYKDMIYLDASYRKDWSSALPADNNGYGYPGIGASFIFSELVDDFAALSFGKLRAGWAQVGNDVDALRLNPVYRTGPQPFLGTDFLVYPNNRLIDPNITPSLNTSFEAGFDLRFINNRVGLSFTYYNEDRKNEIIPVSISQATGYYDFLTNAGESSREGVEVVVDAEIFRSTSGFNWTATLNYANNNTTVEALPAGLDAINAPGGADDWEFVTVVHELGNNWGQLRGRGLARDDDGNYILQPNGLYVVEPNQYFGSVLPDFTGGFVNRFSYKGLTLAAAIDFQKGGKFFSLSEQWGYYSGLLEETAAINDKGNNVRDAVDEGGGVHVVGVTTNGEAVDTYVDALDYFMQFQANSIAEPFIHDASYIKLRDINLSYDFTKALSKSVFREGFIKGATVGLVGRNLWLIAVSDDNKHRWDPSELSQTYGENSQLPGTRGYGVNVRLLF
ncbi:TonB-linked SusC/RagA family outer membrane protein [Pontibacter ummariensis]|uniref:TonB-linked outer membrane protein, SusC/RagA family n=1 Tax=Pontibacter ummariensis TaxID=1610492 RepID=A0A239K7E7_9BACT|nr:SusC/RagA family TonB-linked outer membrane protein [Pontibacter ummariensis]PRY06039.1 TonB-linked SusC/RagA family outer membrane protein [Pontibacter ummariensis]SNT14287.1 TonB-linked outer membrane protein, SusC/RagA family [Pontibacter ummariensis]